MFLEDKLMLYRILVKEMTFFLYLYNLMVETFDISNLDYLI